MEYFYEYLAFLAKTATLVVALLLVVSALAAFAIKRQQQQAGHLEIRKLNEHFQDLKYGIQEAMLPVSLVKRARRRETRSRKQADRAAARTARRAPAEGPVRRRIFVIDFHGDLHASQVRQLREEVTAVLTTAERTDEVVVRVESPGGLVHGYGLAASQLDRVRQHGIPLTVAVDKVAASGGYLMAVVADRIIAAPFAVVGSIGVAAQIPNVHRLLKRHDIDVEVLTAGKYKRTLTMLGENTEEARQKFVEELEEVHALFQQFVHEHRSGIDLERVSTGETWHGQHAVDLNLVDEICTSDAYLLRESENADIFEVRWVEHKRPLERLMAQIETRLDASVERWLGKINDWRGGV
jgi:serine protease SohB